LFFEISAYPFDEALEDPEVVLAVERILLAHACGEHVFFPSRHVLKTLRCCQHFGFMSQQIIRTIDDRYAELAGLAKNLRFTVDLVPERVFSATRFTGRRAVQVPIRDLAWSRLPERVAVVFENAGRDGQFWDIVVRAWLERKGYRISFSMDPVNGGGSGTADEFERCLLSGRWALCIVDSDKTFPDDGLRNTANALAKKWDDLLCSHPNAHILGIAHILPVRELENLIPPKTLDWIFEDSPENLLKIAALSRLLKIDADRGVEKERVRYGFVDLKDGHSFRDDMHPKAKVLFEALKSDLEANGFSSLCDLEQINIGLGDAIIPRILRLTHPKRLYRDRFIANLEKSVFWQEVKEIIEEILAFAIAMPKERTRAPDRRPQSAGRVD